MALYESILASPHRTLNGDEADFFFVPVLDSCIITRADDAPHLSMQVCLQLSMTIADLNWKYCIFGRQRFLDRFLRRFYIPTWLLTVTYNSYKL